MKVKVKKEFELHSNHKAMEDDILDLITINYENDSLFLILEKYGHIFNVYFKDEFDANEHLEFDYQEEKVCSADVYITENERLITEKAEALQEMRKYKAKAKDSIPTSVIEKELEELKNMEVSGVTFKTAVDFAIKILQEILEGRNK